MRQTQALMLRFTDTVERFLEPNMVGATSQKMTWEHSIYLDSLVKPWTLDSASSQDGKVQSVLTNHAGQDETDSQLTM